MKPHFPTQLLFFRIFGVEISLLQRRDLLLLARLPAVMLNAALCRAETSSLSPLPTPAAAVKSIF